MDVSCRPLFKKLTNRIIDSDASLQYWQDNRHAYTDGQIGRMPCWIENNSYKEIDVSSLNYAQHLAYTTIFDHYLQNSENQLLLIITGLEGSGNRCH